MSLRNFLVLATSMAITATCGAREHRRVEDPVAQVKSGAPAAAGVATLSAPASTPAPRILPGAPCPDDMVIVDGSYCPTPRHVCKRWIDPPGPYQFYRCAEYERPAQCTSPREKKHFCIDREEYVRAGDSLPLAHQSWTMADAICKSRGRRICLESEWQFACEGEEMRPYPYGFSRDKSACNIDRPNLGKVNGLSDLRAPITDYPTCMSPFGVHDMSGNVEEWATLDHGVVPDRSTMKGAWWLPGKNTCRAQTVGHGEIYEGAQVGVRCCKDSSN